MKLTVIFEVNKHCFLVILSHISKLQRVKEENEIERFYTDLNYTLYPATLESQLDCVNKNKSELNKNKKNETELKH